MTTVETITIKAGDKVRVHIDTNGGAHGYVGSKGYYMDVVRMVCETPMTDGTTKVGVVLSRVSWVPIEDVELAPNDHACVDGRRVRMIENDLGWRAFLPMGIEPIGVGKKYEDALRQAVNYLWRSK